MGAGAPNGDTQNQGYLRSQHPYVYRIGWLVLWAWAECGKSLSIIFAQWPSMHDPIKYLLNVADHHEADTLTEKWVQGKLQELQYVGLSGALVTGTIASAFSWFSVPDDPWSTQACWTSALLLGFTAIAVATQQTIGLARLCSCEDGWLKVRCLLGEKNPFYGSQDKRPYFSHHRMHREDRVRMKKSQLWIWQTPVMLLNFAILLFVVGLMIAIFVRASRTHWDWSKGQIQIAIFFGCAVFFSGTNYLICWICLNAGSLQSESEKDHVDWNNKCDLVLSKISSYVYQNDPPKALGHRDHSTTIADGMKHAPQLALAASSTLYPLLLRLLNGPSPSPQRLSTSIRAISTLHSTITTLLALYTLRNLPPLPSSPPPPHFSQDTPHAYPNDTQNPLITHRSATANALTALETGYLLSALPSLLREARAHDRRASKTMVAHHGGIGSALLLLQYYILRGRERGILIIVMFMLMNASTPLLNLRWFLRTFYPQKREVRKAVDVLFALGFLAVRVLLVPGVVGVYGKVHGMGVLDTWRTGMRWYCRLGTGALWVGNLAWWVGMVNGMLVGRGRGKAG